MPTLKYFAAAGAPRFYSVHKPVTTIGKALGNDIAIAGRGVADHHAQVTFDGRDFQLDELDRDADIDINGKRKRRARLQHGDRIHLGEVELGFSMFSDAPATARDDDDDDGAARPAPSGKGVSSELAGVRKLFAFSEKLINRGNVNELLEAMLDDVIELTHADKGFLLLIEGAEASAGRVPGKAEAERRLTVRASRNVHKAAITNPDGNISDSIVRQVIEQARAVIVSDALADTNFGQSESVIAMKLSSVMCAPLMSQGEVIGALYVGNDKVKHLFDRPQLELLAIFASQASLILQNAMLLNALREDKAKLQARLSDKKFGEIIGACPSMLDVFHRLQKVAGTDISVLITGETGTGKELIAKELHQRSPRVSGPFVTINCGAIPENLIESELFGHVKGAFTGAIATRAGKFQAADKGTLFLDEIGELPLNLQVKLLRALQERVVVRVGDSKPEKVDIRVVAATNRNLDEEIQRGNFREDLYYRLNVVNLKLPPLRDRGDDVTIIAKMLLSKYADELGSAVRGFSPAALSAIKKHPWPGNIRQLENRIKKALVLCDQTLLSPEDLDLGGIAEATILPLEKAKEEFQRKYVLEVLERNNGNRTQTARDLGVDPRTIFRYLEKEQNPMPSAAGGPPRDSRDGRDGREPNSGRDPNGGT
jgi:transcriptional regulator with GAF, ATPase, and Fis domain